MSRLAPDRMSWSFMLTWLISPEYEHDIPDTHSAWDTEVGLGYYRSITPDYPPPIVFSSTRVDR